MNHLRGMDPLRTNINLLLSHISRQMGGTAQQGFKGGNGKRWKGRNLTRKRRLFYFCYSCLVRASPCFPDSKTHKSHLSLLFPFRFLYFHFNELTGPIRPKFPTKASSPRIRYIFPQQRPVPCSAKELHTRYAFNNLRFQWQQRSIWHDPPFRIRRFL